jgi:signal peptidase II
MWGLALGLLLGGILGNLSDRVFRAPYFFRGSVVDWIRIPYWPVFNLADTSIVISAAAIALLLLKNVKPRSPDEQ